MEEAKDIWQCLEKLCNWWGHHSNKLKTSIFFSNNISDEMKRDMEQLHGWKLKSLSKAGRATLIKSVGLSLSAYAMQTIKLSKKLAAKIDGMDPWVIHGRDFYPHPINGGPEGLEKVADLLTYNDNWDVPKLQNLFNLETTNSIIKGGRLGGQGSDKWIWTKEPNGLFSTKSAYLAQALGRAPPSNVAPALWNKL
uniref:Uncharacterized protein n=1 Tax=Cannabis sativa TaxID=3483 RepID=A0A803PEJ6_CANSA